MPNLKNFNLGDSREGERGEEGRGKGEVGRGMGEDERGKGEGH